MKRDYKKWALERAKEFKSQGVHSMTAYAISGLIYAILYLAEIIKEKK